MSKRQQVTAWLVLATCGLVIGVPAAWRESISAAGGTPPAPTSRGYGEREMAGRTPVPAGTLLQVAATPLHFERNDGQAPDGVRFTPRGAGFILIANPQASPAAVQAEYLLANGQVITKTYTVAGNSRFNICVDLEDPRLDNTALSTRITSTNGVPIIVERAMWWPGPTSDTWQEAHNSPGEVVTDTRWAIAEGEIGGPRNIETCVLIANTSSSDGTARVTVLFEDGTAPLVRTFPLTANSRSKAAPAADFPETRGKRFGMLIESIGTTPAQIVVERAMYSDADGVRWAAGTNALATKLQQIGGRSGPRCPIPAGVLETYAVGD